MMIGIGRVGLLNRTDFDLVASYQLSGTLSGVENSLSNQMFDVLTSELTLLSDNKVSYRYDTWRQLTSSSDDEVPGCPGGEMNSGYSVGNKMAKTIPFSQNVTSVSARSVEWSNRLNCSKACKLNDRSLSSGGELSYRYDNLKLPNRLGNLPRCPGGETLYRNCDKVNTVKECNNLEMLPKSYKLSGNSVLPIKIALCDFDFPSNRHLPTKNSRQPNATRFGRITLANPSNSRQPVAMAIGLRQRPSTAPGDFGKKNSGHDVLSLYSIAPTHGQGRKREVAAPRGAYYNNYVN